MKTNSMKYLSIALAGLLLSAGCTRPDMPEPSLTDTSVRVRLSPDGMSAVRSAAAGATDDSAITAVTGYRFADGVLQETVPGRSDGDGIYTFDLTGISGELRFIANGASAIDGTIDAGTPLDDFLTCSATTASMTDGGLTMTGHMALSDPLPALETISLRRSVARIDLSTTDCDVEVTRVTIRGLADSGYVNPRQTAETPDGAGQTDFTESFDDAPLSNGSHMLLYVCEQSGSPATVEVLAFFGGGLHRMTAALPAALTRNTIYTIRVHGSGADAAISIGSDDWEAGGSTGTTPALQGLIDTQASVLPEGVTVNASQDTVRVSYLGGDFCLALRAEADSQIDVIGNVRGVTTTVEALTRTLQPVAAVSVTSRRRMPNEERAYLYLDVHRGSLYSGRIVVVFDPNPTRIKGLAFDEAGVCDFGRYIDGELGRLELPAGKVARLEFDAGEDTWMKLDESDDALRLLGGWKPNDPKADGRTQEGRLVISDADGSHSESYLIRRLNWGLPVVRIGNNWWCKYNLRGNVKSFADQITIPDDPAADTALADYLASCDEADLPGLMGDQYQGGNRQGLPLKHDGTAFYYEGMQASGQNFGTLDPAWMAPDGYEIPDYDAYAFFTGSNDYNIGGVGTRTYRNRNGEEIAIRVIEREVTLLGQPYGIVSFYEFRTDEGCWVLDGFGHQWNTTAGNYQRMTLLLATSGSGSNSWVMEGYAQNEKVNQNWLKFVSQNATKTRTVRCVKSPVEYIYE